MGKFKEDHLILEKDSEFYLWENLLDSWECKAYEEGLFRVETEDDFLDHMHWIIIGNPCREKVELREDEPDISLEFLFPGWESGHFFSSGCVVQAPEDMHPKACLTNLTQGGYQQAPPHQHSSWDSAMGRWTPQDGTICRLGG